MEESKDKPEIEIKQEKQEEPKIETKEKANEEKTEDPNDPKVEEEAVDEEKLKLAFPTAAIVRIMKSNMDREKMIKKDVKIAMNRWLEKMCKHVSKEINKFPYVMVNMNEFKEGIRVFEDLENFDNEKKRILSHFDAMKKDIERLERDLGKVEEDIQEIQ